MMPVDASDLFDATLAEERRIMDSYAAEYRRWTMTGSLVYRTERAAFARWLLDVLRADGRDPRTLRYLDLGCATGEILEELHGAGCRNLTGIDLSDAMIAEARRHLPAATLVAGALESSTFARESFDVVTGAFTLHHLFDPKSFFRVARDVLAPGGRVFVMEYNDAGWTFRNPTRLAVRLAVAPFRFVVRWKNRARIAAQPSLRGEFNPSHRILSAARIEALARASGFDCTVRTRGLLGQWFLHDVFEESGVDRALVRAFARFDNRFVPAGARTYTWLAGRLPAS